MKSEKIIEFIRHPEKINNDDLRELHTLVERYPYFQTISQRTKSFDRPSYGS